MDGRDVAENVRYHEFLNDLAANGIPCSFCSTDHSGLITVTNYSRMMVVRSGFPYREWDGQPVAEHLLLVPKRHIETIGKFDRTERIEFSHILLMYDRRGYNSYTRCGNNKAKSVPGHCHTHLLKLVPTSPMSKS